MLKIRQGTTDAIEAKIPSDIDLSTITNIWLYLYINGELAIDKELADMAVDSETNRVYCPLTQTETLALPTNATGYLQMRMLDTEGKAYTSDPKVPVFIEEAYKKGVIDNG